MKRIAAAVIAGALFAVGLAVAGMTVPARITAFLDVGGAWDPTLAFVMLAAIAVHAPVVAVMRRRGTPVFAAQLHWPARRGIDPRVLLGAAVFGVGWGLTGYCPGPALTSLATGASALVFVGALIGGIALVRVADKST